MGGRQLSFSRQWCGLPSSVRPCADSIACCGELQSFLFQLFAFLVLAVCLFGVSRLPFWCGGEGGPNYLMQADPLPPYQSDNKLSRKQQKCPEFQAIIVLHNARYPAKRARGGQACRPGDIGQAGGACAVIERARGGGAFYPLTASDYFIARSFVLFCASE